MSWLSVRLGDCCEVVAGATPKTDIEANWGGDIWWATPRDISGLNSQMLFETSEKITHAGYDSCSTRLLPVGSILVSSRAPIGLVAIAGVELCTNQGFKNLIPGPNVHSGYLYHCMKVNSRRLAELGNGATFKEVSKVVVENFEIPLPPFAEQVRIAAILDKATSIQGKRQEAIRLVDDVLRASFFELFGDPNVNDKRWPERAIADISTVTTGNTPSREVADYYGESIEWIKSDNINTPGHWLTHAREGLSELGMSIARTVPAGSTLMTCIAGSASCIGNVALSDRKVAFNQQINAMTPAFGIDPEFLYGLLLYSKPRIQATSTNSMKGMVSKGVLEKVNLIWPPANLQKEFVNIFKNIQRLRFRMEEAEASTLVAAIQSKFFS